MLTQIRQSIIEPLFEKSKKRTLANLLCTIMLGSSLGATCFAILLGVAQLPALALGLGATAVATIALLWLLRQGHLELTAVSLTFLWFFMATFANIQLQTIQTPFTLLYGMGILLWALWGEREKMITAVIISSLLLLGVQLMYPGSTVLWLSLIYGIVYICLLASPMFLVREQIATLIYAQQQSETESSGLKENAAHLKKDNDNLALELSQLQKEHQTLQLDHQELENKVLLLTNEAQAANKELTEFVYMTSHDLKSPLLAVSSLAMWIREDLEDVLTDGTREYMDLLERRVSRMEALLEILLQFSRVKRQMSQPEPVDTAVLIQELIDKLAPPPEFQIEVGPHMPVIVVEKAKLEQVFLQLLSNAIKHHKRPNGRVQISVHTQERFYEFTIQDDGPGIAPRFHQKIFELGQTLQSRDEVEGAGMGLTLVKKIVEHFGGQITITSEEGQGATFCFTWPKTGEPDA